LYNPNPNSKSNVPQNDQESFKSFKSKQTVLKGINLNNINQNQKNPNPIPPQNIDLKQIIENLNIKLNSQLQNDNNLY